MVPVSSSQLGPENCTDTLTIDQPHYSGRPVYVTSGTVCFKCIFNGTDVMFRINISLILSEGTVSSEGRVVNGTLVVLDTERLFGKPTPSVVRCSRGQLSSEISVQHRSKCTTGLYCNNIIFLKKFSDLL